MPEQFLNAAECARLCASVPADPAGALSALTALAKKQAEREAINRLLTDRASVYAALENADPKARKNAARLLGALEQSRDAEALAAALARETTLFVVPSILLALGSVGGAAAKRALAAYTPPEATDETEQKHVLEIRAALDKALATFERDVPLPARTKLPAPRDVLLLSPEGFSPILRKELATLGFAGEDWSIGVLVHTDDLKALFTVRCAQEVLLPTSPRIPFDPQKIALAADELLTRPYRVELRGYRGNRAAMIRKITLALGGGDNPSRYANELYVDVFGNECTLYIRPCDVPDTRFAYRKRTLPASIQPATAACLARYALSFTGLKTVHALDPFCGSGTLLIELEKAAPGSLLLGADISPFALAAARENAQAAHSNVRFLQKDACKIDARDPFDLILTNMPFGNRVGTHESNEPLYRAFIGQLPELLAPGGVAALYTMEHRLLTDCLKHEKRLEIVADMRTEAGGLNPRVTIVKRK